MFPDNLATLATLLQGVLVAGFTEGLPILLVEALPGQLAAADTSVKHWVGSASSWPLRPALGGDTVLWQKAQMSAEASLPGKPTGSSGRGRQLLLCRLDMTGLRLQWRPLHQGLWGGGVGEGWVQLL